MGKQIPQEAYQLAERYELGKPTRMYKLGGCMLAIAVGSLAFCFFYLAVWGFLFFACYEVTIRYRYLWGYAISVIMLVIAITFFFPILSLVRGGLSYIKAMILRTRAYFCSEGVVYISGRESEVLRWEQIEAVEVQNHRSSRLKPSENLCIVHLMDGGQVTWNNDMGENFSKVLKRSIKSYRKKMGRHVAQMQE